MSKRSNYGAIHDYNIFAIAAGSEFAVLNINPEKNYELDVTFVTDKGAIMPGSNFVRSDNSEPDKK